MCSVDKLAISEQRDAVVSAISGFKSVRLEG